LVVHIPKPAESAHGREAAGSFIKQALYGFRYIGRRPSLLGLLMVFLAANFIFNLAYLPLVPMILARTGNNEQLLGIVQSVGAIGGAIGGLWMSISGGPKRRVYGYLVPMIVSATLGAMLLGVAQSPVVWAFALLCESFVSPIMMGSQQAIWQAKVAPDIQGRVFAARRLLGYFSAPIALLIGGPLADDVFSAAMAPGTPLADALGGLIGVGDGAGLGLMMIVFGFFGVFVGIGGLFTPVIRYAETLLPDHDAVEAAVVVPQGAV
jgi:DHA3 family macrolide efflux protein-like MFS transporter